MPQTNNKGVLGLLLLILAAVLVGGGLWYWMSLNSQEDLRAGPSPSATSQDNDIQDLDELEADLDVDSEFKDIDQDLNSL